MRVAVSAKHYIEKKRKERVSLLRLTLFRVLRPWDFLRYKAALTVYKSWRGQVGKGENNLKRGLTLIRFFFKSTVGVALCLRKFCGGLRSIPQLLQQRRRLRVTEKKHIVKGFSKKIKHCTFLRSVL